MIVVVGCCGDSGFEQWLGIIGSGRTVEAVAERTII